MCRYADFKYADFLMLYNSPANMPIFCWRDIRSML